ncbi:MAG: hypothetical protein A2X94_08430 [Bdellovibrionales bacterium GWB1_55_8]|nr:MAG: hypothetical protein A2X94_08430 [Bdellovibrionales bacterium GWB1_55_8]
MSKRRELLVYVSILGYTLIFFRLADLRYLSLFSYEWEDLAQVNSILWNIAHLRMQGLINMIRFTGDTNFHLMPILFPVALLYRALPSVHFLFLLIPFAISVTAIPLFRIARHKLGSNWAAFVVALSFLLYAPKNSLVFLDADPVILTIPFLAGMYWAAVKQKPNWFLLYSVLTGMCRTEAPFYVLTMSSYLWWNSGRSDRTFLRMTVIALIWSAANLLLYVALSNDGLFIDAGTYRIGGLLSFLRGELLLFPVNFSATLLKLFVPLLFIPLFSKIFYTALPALLVLALQREFLPQRAHYLAPMIPIMFLALIDVLEKIRNKSIAPGLPRLGTAVLAIILAGAVASNFAPNILGDLSRGHQEEIRDKRFIGVRTLYDPVFYAQQEDDRVAWRMLNRIPADASVSATGDLIGHLSSRPVFHELLDPTSNPLDVDYILIRNRNMYFGAGHYFWDEEKIRNTIQTLRESPDWELLDDELGLILFQRKHQQL